MFEALTSHHWNRETSMGSFAWKLLAGLAAGAAVMQMPLPLVLAMAGVAGLAYALAPKNTIQR